MDIFDRLKENPNNPRKISPEAFQELVDDLRDDPQQLEIREIVYDSSADYIILGGNKRFRALKQLVETEGFHVKPEYFRDVAGYPDEVKKKFVIKDNLSSGSWDEEILELKWMSGITEKWAKQILGWKIEQDIKFDDNGEPIQSEDETTDETDVNIDIKPSESKFVQMVLHKELHEKLIKCMAETENSTVPEVLEFLIDFYNENINSQSTSN